MTKSMAGPVFEGIRVGIVSTVNREKATARVYFEDREDVVSPELKVLNFNTLHTKHYWMPEVNQTVICLFAHNEPETGYILAGVYSEVDKVHEEFLVSEDVDGVRYPDGSVIKYDSINHKLIIDIKGEVEIRATNDIIINGRTIYLN